MASGLKWALGLVAGCVLVALILSRVESPFRQFIFARNAEHMRVLALKSEIHRTNARLARIARNDSLLPLMTGSKPVIGLSKNLTDSAAAELRAAIVADLARVQPSRARIGVFVVDKEYGGHAAAFTWQGARYEYYAGRDALGTYCMVVGLARPDRPSNHVFFRFSSSEVYSYYALDRSDTVVNVLGPCRLWARYGHPSPAVGNWLKAGAYRLAEAPSEWPVPKTAPRRRGRFGLRGDEMRWLSMVSPLGASCLAGRPDDCAAAVADTGRLVDRASLLLGDEVLRPTSSIPRSSSPEPLYWSVGGGGVFGLGDEAMLAKLEQQYGPERFAKFWSAPAQDVDTAFESAFGLPLGEWVMQWAQKTYGVEPKGPRVDFITALLSILMLGAMIGIAIAVAQRRQVQ